MSKDTREPLDIIEIDPFDPAVVEAYDNRVEELKEKAPDQAKVMLETRRLAYVAVFTAGVAATQDQLNVVLADLAWFSKMYTPTYDIRDGIHAEELSKRKEGRREVFQRIQHFSRLNMDALLLMYTNATTQ